MQEKVIKYSQFHVDGDVSDGLRAQGLPVAEYDGGVNIWGKSLEDLMAVSDVLLFLFTLSQFVGLVVLDRNADTFMADLPG